MNATIHPIKHDNDTRHTIYQKKNEVGYTCFYEKIIPINGIKNHLPIQGKENYLTNQCI